MAKATKENRGGFRENAKRPLKYGEKTVLIGPFHVPESKAEDIKSLVKKELKKFEVKPKK